MRDLLVRVAEGLASRELAYSLGEISALLAKYESYKLAPEVTRKRMYIEMMEKVIKQSGPKMILDSGINSPTPYINVSPGAILGNGQGGVGRPDGNNSKGSTATPPRPFDGNQ